VRFLWFFEFDLDDSDEIRRRNKELKGMMAKDPDGYPALLPSYMTGLGEGFRVVDAENEDQLIRLIMHFHPLERWRLEPVFEGAQVSKIWNTMA
jgi:hypothetical protein